MRQNDGGAFSADDVGHFLRKLSFVFVGETVLRRDVTPGAYVVYDLGACVERGFGDRRTVRVDGNRNGNRVGKSLYDGNNASDLLRFADRFRSGPRAFAADVEDRRAVSNKLFRLLDDGV